MGWNVRVYSYETSTSVWLTGTSATIFAIEQGGWTTETPVFTGKETALETFTIRASGTYAQILSEYNSLIDLLNRARISQESLTRRRTFSVFLTVQTDADDRSAVSDTRKAAIIDYEITPLTDTYYGPHMFLTDFRFQLTIERVGAWETFQTTGQAEDEEDANATTTSLSSLGGVLATTIGNRGSAVGRIPFVDIDLKDQLYTGWMGIRHSDTPSNTSQTPVTQWNFSNGTKESGNSNTADATAENGTRVTCAIGSTMAKEVSITASQASATGAGNFGRWLVLGRFKLSASGTAAIQMRSTYQFDASRGTAEPPAKRHTLHYFSDTSWRVIEMGFVDIPVIHPMFEAYNGSSYAIGNFECEIWAQQLSGSPDLHADLLIMIPGDHYIKWTAQPPTGSTGGNIVIGTDVYWNQYSMLGPVTGSGYESGAEIAFKNWFIEPRSDNVHVVVAAERETSSDATDLIDLDAFQIIYGWQHFLDATT